LADFIKIYKMSKSFNYLPDFILEGAIMYTDKGLYIAKAADRELYILSKMANRHGLIAGATGSGKSVCINTLIMREPVFSDGSVRMFSDGLRIGRGLG